MGSLVLIGQVYAALALVAFLFCIPPIFIQARYRNLPVMILIVSLLILNLQNFINAVIWPSWQDNQWEGQGLCDVEIRIYAALPVAATGAVACIFRQLASALRTDRVGTLPSKRQRICNWGFELALCVLFPLIVVAAVHLTTAYWRYSLVRVLGCMLTIRMVWTGIILQLIWQPINALIATVYCGITIFRLVRHRRNVSAILSSSGMNKNRHTRLFVLSSCGLLLVLPGAIYLLIWVLIRQAGEIAINSRVPDLEDHLSRQITKITWGALGVDRIALRWGQMAMTVPILGALGLGKEAHQVYRRLIPPCVTRWHAKQMLRKGGEQSTGGSGELESRDGPMAFASSQVLRKPTDDVERELWLVDNESQLEGTRLRCELPA